jgi:integrase
MARRRRGYVVERAEGRWYSYISATDATGKRVRPRAGPFPTRMAAEAKLAEMLVQQWAGTFVLPDRTPLGEYLTQWLASHRAHVKPSTWSSYEMHCRCYIAPAIGSIPLHKLTAAHLNSLYASLLNGRGNRGRALAAKTTRYTHVIIRRALADAVREGILGRNVADAARPPRPQRPPMQTWDAEQLADFLRGTEGDDIHPLWLTLSLTGMRRGEALGLVWSSIDFATGAARIDRAIIAVNNVVQESSTKTGRGRRVPLPAEVLDALRQLRGDRIPPPGERIFPWHPNAVTKAFVSAQKRLGIDPTMKLHGLRHTWATLGLRANVHPKVIQSVLGHSSISTTLDIYSHVAPGLSDAASALIASLVLPGDAGQDAPVTVAGIGAEAGQEGS